jgi:hypothetical protein
MHMSSEPKDPIITALELVHNALKPLDPDQRKKVLAGVFQLLEISDSPLIMTTKQRPNSLSMPQSARPLSLNELIQDKRPKTNSQFIVLYAYYREKMEGLSRFSRNDLKDYFGKAKEKPPTNYDRDFVDAVKKGWLHEDASDSYITSRGIEAVESSFERKTSVRAKSSK